MVGANANKASGPEFAWSIIAQSFAEAALSVEPCAEQSHSASEFVH